MEVARLIRLFSIVAQQVSACSIALQSGLVIEALNATSSSGPLRIDTAEYGSQGEKLSGVRSVGLDFKTGTLKQWEIGMPSSAVASTSLDFGAASRMTGYSQASTRDDLLINGNGLNNDMFTLPGLLGSDGLGWDGSRDQWWYSAARGRYYFLYQSNGGSRLVVCTAPGHCDAPVSLMSHGSGWDGYSHYYDEEKVPVVYDAVSLVKLPLQCCVCLSFVYFKFGDRTLSSMPILNTLDPIAYDASSRVVYAAAVSQPSGRGDRMFNISSHELASGKTASVVLTEANLRGFVGGAPLQPDAIAAIAGGSAVVPVLLILVGWLILRARRRRPTNANNSAAMPMDDAESTVSASATPPGGVEGEEQGQHDRRC